MKSPNGGPRVKVKDLSQGSPLNRNKPCSIKEKTNSIESGLKEKRNSDQAGTGEGSVKFS